MWSAAPTGDPRPQRAFPTAVEVVQVFKDWSEAHPEWYASPGWDGAAAALRSSWPCLAK